MKNLLFVAFLFVQFFSYAQVTYNLSGHAYLDGETDHSAIVVSIINPLSLSTVAVGYTDEMGEYSIDATPGFYLLNWSHYGHIPQELGNFAFSTDTVLTDVTLLSGYVQDVCGEVSGVWPSGSVYDVLCDIEILEGDTLTIESGVRVRFTEGTQMVCNGVLQVLGESGDRVSFTSREASPLPGDWGNVSLYAQGNTISHLDYEFATDGFTGDNISNTTIDNVVMVGNLSLSANGIYLTNSSDLTITNNTIQVGGEYGIHSYESDNSVVNNNTITGLYSTTIEMKDCDNCHFEGNTLSGNTVLQLEYSNSLVIHDNHVLDHEYGFKLYQCNSAQVTSNEMIKPTSSMFGESVRNFIYNYNSSSTLIEDNVFSIEDGNRGQRHWDALIVSHQSVIRNNTYIVDTPSMLNGSSFIIYANESVISGNTSTVINKGHQDYVFLRTTGSENNRSVVENNIINITSTDHGRYDYNTDWNGIISLHGYTDCINNTVNYSTANNASWREHQAGLISSSGAETIISGNTLFSSERSFTVYFENSSSQIFTNNVIYSERGSSAIKISNSDVLISHNLIDSQVRGIEMNSQSGGEIINNTIVSPNSADYGIHISNLSAPVVQNNIIEGFTNGIYAENDLQNQFIQNNNLWDISEDIFSGTAMPALVGEMIDLNVNGAECDIYSNLNMDPLFMNPDSTDYNLQATSPCINAGNEGSELDPDGTIADMGAFYYPDPIIDTTIVVDPVTYIISGHAYLENETDHSSLLFSVINPQSLDTLAFTSPDSSGSYSMDVSPGFYLLNWSHYGHIPQELGNFAFSTDTVLTDVTLLSGYVQDVCGEVSGVWPSGSVYDVLCDIEVPAGDTLTIESGVRVRFTEGTQMVCNGVLQVLGESGDRVSFTSREASPLPGDWGNVSLYAQGNTISHLDYEFATDGFTGDNISNTTIDNVVMVGNLSLSANGIYLTNSSDLTITNNTIQVGGEYGIHSYESDNSVVNNNTITGSYSTTIEMKDCDNCHFEGNTLSGNTVLQLEYSNSLVIHDNHVLDHEYGFKLYQCNSAQVTSNEMIKPTSSMFGESVRNFIYNYNSSSTLIEDNVFSIEDGNRGQRHWDALIVSHQSVIRNNTYIVDTPSMLNGSSFIIYANESVISGNTSTVINKGHQDYVFLRTTGSENNRSVVENNIINITSTDHGRYDYNTDWNGIISLHGYTDCINNTVNYSTANNASWREHQAGLISSSGAETIISGNTLFSSERSFTVYFENSSSQIFTNNVIYSERGSSAIKISNSDVLISHNLIDSQVRGIEMNSQSGGEIINNTIVSPNSADYGIHISNLSAPVVQNNIIEGFTNGIYAENDLQNQFIQNNNLWDISEDIFSGTAMPALVGEMIDLNVNGAECDIYSNLNMDPLFMNPDSTDYNLQATSPCINAGNEGSELDPDGTIADMGAFYYPDPIIDTTIVVDPVTYIISGHAYLENETDHSSLLFSVINPQSLDTLAFTSPDSSGSYSMDVSPGFYLLNWSHYGHIPQELGNFAFSTDTVLTDVTLLSGYVQDVCGEVSGVWPSGSVYDVLCDIEVPAGDTLTIESGVRVRFTEGTQMVCNGVLQVLGESGDRVSFTSREASPLPGDWGNVSLYAQGNTISHLDYEFATDGFTGDNISNTTIDNVVMVGNLSLSANGIYLTNSSDLTITNNTIQVGGEYGIHSYESDNSVVNNNTITGSYSTTIEMKDCDNCHFEGNTLSGNTVLQLEYSNSLVIHDNHVLDHEYGFKLYQCNSAQVTSNEMIKPTSSMFGESVRNFIYNYNSSSTLIEDNVFSIEDGNRGQRHWDALIVSHQSVIRNNTYIVDTPSMLNGSSFIIYANESVISGNTSTVINKGHQDYVFLRTTGSENNRSVVENNIINITSTDHGRYDYNTDWNGIISLHGYTDCINNTVNYSTANNASWREHQAGLISSSGAETIISGNTLFSSERSFTVYFENSSSQIFTNNVIYSERGSSAIKISNSDVLISHNLIDSQVRGIEMNSQSGGEIINNTIVSPNSADYGIHISNLSAPVVQNNIIEGFTNGIYAENDLQNQFIQNNNLWDISEDIFSGTAMPALVGEMIDLNTNGDTCDIYSNLNMDPLFMNPDSTDYNLQATSPCINAGNEGSELDPDGTIADMGAFYYPYPPIYGCVDEIACNFDTEATDDDGSCTYPEESYDCDGNCLPTDGESSCFGCTISVACNYDANATIEDGSCEFNCPGCTDEVACNYNSYALQEDGSCLYIFDLYGADNVDCNGVCLSDVDGDGVCDEDEIFGCLDEEACNYDFNVTEHEDELCLYAIGCDYCENNAVTNGDIDGDGVCNVDEIFGCNDTEACNFDSIATELDDSCLFAIDLFPSGYYDCDEMCINDIDGDGVCDELEILGCTDEDACNYDSNATDSDALSCIYAIGCDFCENNAVTNGDTDGDGVCDVDEIFGCVDAEACNYDDIATESDGSCLYAIDLFPSGYYDCDEICFNDTDGDGVCDELEILGCTDEEACNYDSNATDNDALSCIYAIGCDFCENNAVTNGDTDGDGVCDVDEIFGCVDAEACNYDSIATESDGSCLYAIDLFPSGLYDCDEICFNDTDGDGVCDELEILGCTDEEACNYDSNATDSASCTYAEDYYNCEGNCLVDMDEDGVCDELEILGCNDTEACNFDSLATELDESCLFEIDLFPSGFYTCEGICINDIDGDGVCDELEILGCMDTVACNFDSTATDSEDSCEYLTCAGCTYPYACNYDPSATILDDSCEFGTCAGCTDINACNFNPTVFEDDGSCEYCSCTGEFPEGDCDCNGNQFDECGVCGGEGIDIGNCDCEGNQLDIIGICGGSCTSDVDGNGVCDDVEILGCMDVNACTYNMFATQDDGSCLAFVNITIGGGSWDSEISWSFLQDGEEMIAEGNSGSYDICIGDGCFSFSMLDSYGDGWNGATYTITNTITGEIINSGDLDSATSGDGLSYGVNYLSINTTSCGFGCTDETACNYNSEASIDDDTCIYPEDYYDCDGNCLVDVDEDGVCDEEEILGCSDTEACNFDSLATELDESCIFAIDLFPSGFYNCEGICISDIDGDGVCDEEEILGCNDTEACNFDSLATELDESCIFAIDLFPSGFYNCEGICISDIDGDGVCDEEEILGCMENLACNFAPNATDSEDSCEYLTCAGCTYEYACNYDASATILDDSCEFGNCPGCTDINACNFNPTVLEDDGSCEYCSCEEGIPEGDCDCDGNQLDACGVCGGDSTSCFGCTFEIACNYDDTAVIDDGSCEFDCPGCTDELACNYNAEALQEDGSCEYIFILYGADNVDCSGECLNDIDGDGVCDEDEISGCTETTSCNYNSLATDEDGSCTYDCYGCMDEVACNFDSEASLPNNSGCEYPDLGYDCLGECILDTDSDGVCDMFEIAGCTDLFANNFNSDATDDDGSCVFPPLSLNAVSDTLCLGDTVIISWTGGDPNDPIYIGLINVTTNSGNGAVVNETSNTGSYSWLFQGVPAGPGDIYKFYITNLPLTTYDYGNHFAICPIVGCMDPMACNYDETATLDDGSCVMPDECGICDGIASGQGIPDGDCDCDGNQLDILGVCGGDCISDFNGNGICDINETFGCTYSLAINYNTNATVDDGSCEYCTSDLDGNGNVSTSDLLMFLVSFGQYCDEVDACGVINGDGSSCADCAGVPNGTSVVDECGVCGGDGSSCALIPITNDNIHEAVDLWLSDEASAETTYGHISEWDVSSVTDMSWMFEDTDSYNGDLSSWDVSSVTDMNHMFYYASSFNGDISSWDVSSVTDIGSIFDGASNFNGDISSWDVSSVTNMDSVFELAQSFNGDISSWDVSSVTNMGQMFENAHSFNGNISSWDVSSVTNMGQMFYQAFSFNQDLSSWDVSSVGQLGNMFYASALSEENQCAIHTSFSSNANWLYDWSGFCPPAVFISCGDQIGHEGYDYSTVQIGDQCWFSENCRYLPEVSPSIDGSETDPYYYVYDYQGTDVEAAKATENYETYGVLYNWPAVMTEGICPSGWHVPSDEEFTQLTDFLGGEGVAGGNMKDDVQWNGSNSSGWSGLPGGFFVSGNFFSTGDFGDWWSSSESGSLSWGRVLDLNDVSVVRDQHTRSHGFSARCIQD